MLDTGFDLTHETFASLDVLGTWDFINNDGNVDNEGDDPPTSHRHGTMTLSTLAGNMSGRLVGPAFGAAVVLAKTEDSGEGHENDALWAYHLEDKTLTRLVSAPLGAELTSAYYYPDIGGYGYLMTVVQHPFAGVSDPPADPTARRAQVGYLGPFPAP